MKLTKKQIETILGYEVADFKIIKKAYRGEQVRSMTVSVSPKYQLETVTMTISTDSKKLIM